MIRAAALVSGDGALLQTVLDSMYFGEIPNFELTAVICTESDAYALRRARNSGVEAFVVEPSLFPTKLSYSMAVSNKLRDMDIDLVILAGYNMPLGVISTQFRKRIIGVYPSLIPAFVNCDDAPERAALERGCRVTGAFCGYRRQYRRDHRPAGRGYTPERHAREPVAPNYGGRGMEAAPQGHNTLLPEQA